MNKIPIYNSLLERKTVFSMPQKWVMNILMLFIPLYVIFETVLVIVPLIFLLGIVAIVSKNDLMYIDIYLKNTLRNIEKLNM